MRRLLIPALLLLTAVPGAAQYVPTYTGGPEMTVRGWYQRYLGRDVNGTEAAGWIDALARGQDPNQLLAGILASDEYYISAGSDPSAFIRKLYRDLTGREPSPQEFQYGVARVYREPRTNIAYAMLTRYPQDMQPPAAYPQATQPPPPPPQEVQPPPRPWRHPYEYRRPYWRYDYQRR